MENEIFVRDYRGRLHAEVDDGNWEAFIPVTLPFAEFALPEELLLLRDIAETASAQSGFPLPETDDETIALTRELLHALMEENSLD
jgi:hypothetical protein